MNRSSNIREYQTWALTIGTYQRSDELKTCIRCAINGTRPPDEIIVVDSSENWGETRDQINLILLESGYKGRLHYENSEVKSSAVQRNRAVYLANSDVVFVIDDDSFLYRDAAEKIMEVYEHDTEKLIGGVSPLLSPSPPPEISDNVPQELYGEKLKLGLNLDAAATNSVSEKTDAAPNFSLRSFLRSVLRADDIFVPYDIEYPNNPIPKMPDGINIARIKAMHGARMTFRREAILKVQFSPILRGYTAGEDSDASYRVSRNQAIVQVIDAFLYHMEAPGGRLSPYVVLALGAMNTCVLHRLYGVDPKRSLREMRKLLYRRMIIQVFNDLSSREFTFPRARGIAHGLRNLNQIFDINSDKLTDWYSEQQNRLIENSR